MSGPTRPYQSTLRAEQARETRGRIVTAGHELFVELGYAHTTVDAIAARAGVSRKTVFTSVGGKPGVLKLAWDWALAGDDEPVAMAERPEVQARMELRDPAAFVTAWTALQAAIALRLAPLFDVLTVAADGDAEVAALLTLNERNRSDGARRFVEHLAAIGGLRPDLPADRAVQVTELLMDPVPCRRLVLDGGWTLEEYSAYVERVAVATLLA